VSLRAAPVLLVGLTLAGSAAAAPRLPAEVRQAIARREACNHWAGEEPYDRARAREIAANVRRLGCVRLEKDEARLRRRYARRPGVLRALRAAQDREL